MKKKKNSKFCLTNDINNKISYGIILAVVIIGFAVIGASAWSLNSQMDRLINIRSVSFSSVKCKSSRCKTEKLLTVKIKVDGKKQRIFDGENENPDKISILEALDEIKETKGLEFDYETRGDSVVVKNINGIEVNNNNNLIYYLNGKPITGDIKKVEVSAGDLVEIVTL